MTYIKFKQVILGLCISGFLTIAANAQGRGFPAGEWRLAEMNGRRVSDSTAYIDISAREKRISGNAGCNRMFGSVTGEAGRIVFSKIGTTKMACPDNKASRTEAQFLKAIQSVNRYRESGETLSLYARNRVVLKFTAVRKLPPEVSTGPTLESMKWVLEMIGSQRVIGAAASKTPFISFDAAKKSAGGDTSCNVFGGTYTSAGDTIAISDIISTMRACVEDNRMEIERQFKDGLEKVNRYEILNGKLTLYGDSQSLLTFRGEAK